MDGIRKRADYRRRLGGWGRTRGEERKARVSFDLYDPRATLPFPSVFHFPFSSPLNPPLSLFPTQGSLSSIFSVFYPQTCKQISHDPQVASQIRMITQQIKLISSGLRTCARLIMGCIWVMACLCTLWRFLVPVRRNDLGFCRKTRAQCG